MNTINFKPYFLNRLLNRCALIAVLGLGAIYLALNLNGESQTTIAGVFIAILFFLCIYLSRFDPKLIKFDKQQVEITYLMNPPYGKGRKIYNKNQLYTLHENDTWVVYNNESIVAKIRRKAVDPKNWEELVNYLID